MAILCVIYAILFTIIIDQIDCESNQCILRQEPDVDPTSACKVGMTSTFSFIDWTIGDCEYKGRSTTCSTTGHGYFCNCMLEGI